MKIKAYAKVNLCLKVYKGLADNKHRIDSVMFLYRKLYDIIDIKKTNYQGISYWDNKKEIHISNCLVYRSLQYLKAKYGFDVNYKIEIIKKIPFGGGLGGGSADAAAVMNYVLHQNKPVQLDLQEIAMELGSDIPFFLSGYQMARVKEYGQYVAPIYNWRPKIELHFTKVACSTTKSFTSLEEDPNYVSKVNVDKIIKSHLYKQHFINVVYNDLTKYIIQNYKELQSVYKTFTNNSFFTGAGSTIVTLKDKHEG